MNIKSMHAVVGKCKKHSSVTDPKLDAWQILIVGMLYGVMKSNSTLNFNSVYWTGKHLHQISWIIGNLAGINQDGLFGGGGDLIREF